MPDPNGTAALMKCDDVSQLEQYLCSLSVQLNVECSEVVPVEFYAEQSKTKCRLDQEARFHALQARFNYNSSCSFLSYAIFILLQKNPYKISQISFGEIP